MHIPTKTSEQPREPQETESPAPKPEVQSARGDLDSILHAVDNVIGENAMMHSQSTRDSRAALAESHPGALKPKSSGKGRPRTRADSENYKNYDGGAPPPAELKEKHLEIFRLMITYPTMTRKEISAKLGVSYSWISVVVNSDLFQEMLKDHRERFLSEAGQNVYERQRQAVDMAMGRITEHLERSNDPEYALEVAKGLGKNITGGKDTGREDQGRDGVLGIFSQDDLRGASEVLLRVKRDTAPLEEGRVNKTKAIDGEATIQSGT